MLLEMDYFLFFKKKIKNGQWTCLVAETRTASNFFFFQY